MTGDGVSSSLSNSTAQRRQKFPRFTMRDMVRSRHELLTRVLHIDQVYAVAGFSMGGCRPGDRHRFLHELGTRLGLLDSTHRSRDAMSPAAGINELELRTPAWIAKNVTDPGKTLEEHRKAMDRLDPFDSMSQLRAMIAHDISADFHPPLRPKVLIVDALVTLSGDCGHLATACERKVLMREVAAFLGQ